MAVFDKTLGKIMGLGKGVAKFAGRHPRLTGTGMGALVGGGIGAGVAGPDNRGAGFLGGAVGGGALGFYGMGRPRQLGLPGMGRETRFGDMYQRARGSVGTAMDRLRGAKAFDYSNIPNGGMGGFMRSPVPEGFEALKGTQLGLLDMPTFGLGKNLAGQDVGSVVRR